MKANKMQEEYPIHFRDKIDEYLYREHGILAGCCSSVESLKYDVAREVAEKLTNILIEKASDWLNDFYNEDTNSFLIDKDIEEFENFMKSK